MSQVFNIDFDIVAFFMLLVIYVYIRTKYSIKTRSNKEFFRLVRVSMFACALDMVSSLFLDWRNNYYAAALSTHAYFVLAVLTGYFIFRYILSFVPNDATKKARIEKTNDAVLCFYMAVLAINVFTGFLYEVTPDIIYVRKPVFPIIFFFVSSYMIEAIVFIQIYHKFFTTVQRVYLTTAAVIVIVFPFLQAYLFPHYLITYFGVSIIIFMLLFVIETPDEQKLHTTLNHLDALHEDLERSVEEKTREVLKREDKLNNLTNQLMYTLAETIDAKDRYTSGHSARVARYSRMLAREAGLPEDKQKEIYSIGILHDVGKIGIPNSIINKTGKLTDEEYAVMKSHPAIGADILSKVTMFPELSIGARWHHERIDGKGYPDGLKGDRIPELVRIISVADAYDAMTSYRSYRSVMPQEEVRKQIVNGRGSQFDEHIADLMIKLIDEDINYEMHEYKKTGE